MIETVKNHILSIFDDCRDLSEQQLLNDAEDRFGAHADELNRLAAREVEPHVVDALMSDRTLQPVIRKIAALKRIHGSRIERERAGSILDSSAPWETLKGFVYYPNYLKLAEMEVTGAELNRGDRVVFLGSGPLPLSLIVMVHRYGVKGIGIERDPDIADLSRKVIDALELSDKIEIISADHFVLPLPQPCSLIMVGADAVPKNEIFSHLAENLPDGMKLSYRTNEKGLRRLFDLDNVGALPAGLKEYRRIRPQPPVNNTSVFLIRENGHE